MTNDLNDHFPRSLRSSLAEVLKTIETIGTIFFSLLAHLSRVDRRWAVDGRFPPPSTSLSILLPSIRGGVSSPEGCEGEGL